MIGRREHEIYKKLKAKSWGVDFAGRIVYLPQPEFRTPALMALVTELTEGGWTAKEYSDLGESKDKTEKAINAIYEHAVEQSKEVTE